MHAAWVALRSATVALITALRAAVGGGAAAAAALARAAVGLETPKRWVRWLLQLARFKEMPLSAQVCSLLYIT